MHRAPIGLVLSLLFIPALGAGGCARHPMFGRPRPIPQDSVPKTWRPVGRPAPGRTLESSFTSVRPEVGGLQGLQRLQVTRRVAKSGSRSR